MYFTFRTASLESKSRSITLDLPWEPLVGWGLKTAHSTPPQDPLRRLGLRGLMENTCYEGTCMYQCYRDMCVLRWAMDLYCVNEVEQKIKGEELMQNNRLALSQTKVFSLCVCVLSWRGGGGITTNINGVLLEHTTAQITLLMEGLIDESSQFLDRSEEDPTRIESSRRCEEDDQVSEGRRKGQGVGHGVGIRTKGDKKDDEPIEKKIK